MTISGTSFNLVVITQPLHELTPKQVVLGTVRELGQAKITMGASHQFLDFVPHRFGKNLIDVGDTTMFIKANDGQIVFDCPNDVRVGDMGRTRVQLHPNILPIS